MIFLAEAFTRPKMMRKLAKVGFQQSYTYFTWRNTKQELIEYMTELARARWASTTGRTSSPTRRTSTRIYLQTSGPAGFIVRGTLAATLSSVYGIYNGFELCEGTPIPARRNISTPRNTSSRPGTTTGPATSGSTSARSTASGARTRRSGTSATSLFLNAWNDQILAYARMTPEKDNCVLVLVNLDPQQPAGMHLRGAALGVRPARPRARSRPRTC